MSRVGTLETCQPSLSMSVYRRRVRYKGTQNAKTFKPFRFRVILELEAHRPNLLARLRELGDDGCKRTRHFFHSGTFAIAAWCIF